MYNISTYKLSFLRGTQEFVLKELQNKFPKVEIKSKNNNEIVFESSCEEIEAFKNLYSPTQIENEKSIILNLSKREWRKEYVSAGINPSLAYIICDIAELRSEDIVYDPFCGASILPITALKYFNVKRVICSDISSKAIAKSKVNFETVDIPEEKYMIFKSDIKDVTLSKKNVDVIISNLPFGIRVGSHDENLLSYVSLRNIAEKILRTKGKLVLLTQEKKLIREVFGKEHWKVKSMARVNAGGLLPEVFVIKRILK